MSEIPSALDILTSLTGFQKNPNGTPAAQDQPPLMGTIDPAYTGVGNPKVTFDGETTTGARTYPWIGTPPLPSSRVVMLPVGRSYVILGGLGAPYARIDSGFGSIPGVAAGGNSGVIAIAFKANAFTTAPSIVAMPNNGRLTPGYSSLGTTGCNVTFSNWSPAAAGAASFAWIATQT